MKCESGHYMWLRDWENLAQNLSWNPKEGQKNYLITMKYEGLVMFNTLKRERGNYT